MPTIFFTDDELAKLPVWARQKVQVLNMNMRHVIEENEKLLANPVTRVWQGNEKAANEDRDTRRFFEVHRPIKFNLSPEEGTQRIPDMEIRLLDRYFAGDRIHCLQLISSNGNELVLQPRSGNVLELMSIGKDMVIK